MSAIEDEEKLQEFFGTSTGRNMQHMLEKFLSALQESHDHAQSSVELVMQTMTMLRNFVGSQRYYSANHLMQTIRAVGRRIREAKSSEIVIMNATLRVLFTIREECETILSQSVHYSKNSARIISLGIGNDINSFEAEQTDIIQRFDLVNSEESAPSDLRPFVIAAITEVLSELENVQEPISKQASDHIHDNDVILVAGYSTSLVHFLSFARSHGKSFFCLVVGSKQMVDELKINNVKCQLIGQASINAVMPKVSKVLISPKAVLANGSVVASAGTKLLSLSAKYYHVPLVCVSGLHKLTPQYSLQALDLTLVGGSVRSGQLKSELDLIPPEEVSLLITNTGGHQTSYVYRLLTEYYNPIDVALL